MTFTYPHGTVELHFFDGRLREPSADPEPDTGFVWVPVEALATLPFPEANRDVVASLVETSRSIATSRDASEARPADR
jgi:hypothetical protein